MPDIDHLVSLRDEARDKFATLGDLRPGSLAEVFTKCGKANCRCAVDDDYRHSSHLLHRSIGGKKKTVRVRARDVDATQGLVDEYRRFKEIMREFLEASEALAMARLDQGAEKGGSSGRPSRRRSPGTSTA